MYKVLQKMLSNLTIKFAKIRIVFLGDQGSVIGGTADNVWNLAPGETWNFRGGTWKFNSEGNRINIKEYKLGVVVEE